MLRWCIAAALIEVVNPLSMTSGGAEDVICNCTRQRVYR